MLHAFKDQLKTLAASNLDEFRREIGWRAPNDRADAYVDPVRNLVIVMPDLIGLIQIWSDDERVPAVEKTLHGFVLTYLYHPADFIPDSGSRFFSYVDDAYLVGSAFLRTFQHLEGRGADPALQALAANVRTWLQRVRELIPVESGKIDALLGELVNGRRERFDELLGRGAAPQTTA
jgi:uncharacterized membrane protein YkvA (DUF1232 family)